MSRQNIRERTRRKRNQQKLRSRLIAAGIGIIVLGLLSILAWNLFRPAAGTAVPIMDSALEHVSPDTLPEYSTDPPTSGPHLGSSLDAGFYRDSDLNGLPPRPEGHLVHNLEHGYVIFWYNCESMQVGDCTDLQNQIQAVMDRFNNAKLIAFPWPSIREPVVMTSWGQIQRFEAFDSDTAARFIRANRNRAPEPGAP